MYRLLIVDDEKIIVEGLYRLFSGLSYLDLEIYKAYKGSQAMDILNKIRIDIVITDISMPGMDGMQLLENIKACWPECRVIFLTGCNQFDYVYTAIQHKDISFLLKTEDDSKLIEKVEMTMGEIEKNRSNTELAKKVKDQLTKALPILQKEYLASLILSEKAVMPAQRQLDELELPLKADQPLILLLGSIDNLSKVLSVTERMQWTYTIELMVEQHLYPNMKVAHSLHEDYFIWLIQPEPGKSYEKTALYIRETLEIVQKACMESLNAIVSFVLEREIYRWDQISDKYFEMRQLLNSHIGLEKGVIITGKTPLPVEAKMCSISSRNTGKIFFQLNRISTMESYLDRGQRDDFFDLFREIAEPAKKIASMHYIPALEIYFSMALMFLSYINRWECTEKLSSRISTHKLTSVEEFNSWNDAMEYLRQMAEAILELQISEKQMRDVDTIAFIRQYIVNHLAEDLSLPKLGELVYFNPFYLSRLFRKVTGTTVTDYIQQARINRAKELLAKNGVKIHEIAALVGYEFPAYFAKIFKKATNMTPQEYRDSLIGV